MSKLKLLNMTHVLFGVGSCCIRYLLSKLGMLQYVIPCLEISETIKQIQTTKPGTYIKTVK